MAADYGCLCVVASIWLYIAAVFYWPKNKNMYKLTEKILKYTEAKYTLDYCKWYIGLTDNPKETKKDFQNKNKIVCAYFKTWPCKNKTEAKKILKEIEIFDFIICKKTPKPIIFVFLSVKTNNFKYWKILNAPRTKENLFIID